MPITSPSSTADHQEPENLQKVREAALMTVFTTYRPGLLAYCRKIGVPESDMDDVLQDTWIVAATHLHQLRLSHVGTVWGWVCRTLHRRVLNGARRRREVLVPESDFWAEQGSGNTTSPAEDPLQILLDKERTAIIQVCIDTLPVKEAPTIRDYYLKGGSIESVAKAHKTPPGSVKRRLHDARKRLLAILPSDLESDA